MGRVLSTKAAYEATEATTDRGRLEPAIDASSRLACEGSRGGAIMSISPAGLQSGVVVRIEYKERPRVSNWLSRSFSFIWCQGTVSLAVCSKKVCNKVRSVATIPAICRVVKSWKLVNQKSPSRWRGVASWTRWRLLKIHLWKKASSGPCLKIKIGCCESRPLVLTQYVRVVMKSIRLQVTSRVMYYRLSLPGVCWISKRREKKKFGFSEHFMRSYIR